MRVVTGVGGAGDYLGCVCTIGIFDGVHLGHQQILRTLTARAAELGLASVAITFDPHPAMLHQPERDVQLIMPLMDRIDAMANLGVDATWLVPYTWELAELSPRDFAKQYFADALAAREIVVGADMLFGAGNSGNVETLRSLGTEMGFTVTEVTDICSVSGRRWSSTWVRECLAEGDVRTAAQVLGRPYRLRGRVVHGFQRGRTLGFPTANLNTDDLGMVPAEGVYAGWLMRTTPGTGTTEHLPAAISVGHNIQFDALLATVEAHVLGRGDLNLYGQVVAVDFIERIRGMMRFDSVEELTARMDVDLRESALLLGVPPAGRIDPAIVTAQ